MTPIRWILVAALALGVAGAANAGSKTTLVATTRTLAGPGTNSITAGGNQVIFSQGAGEGNVCVTVVNSGKEAVTVNVTGNAATGTGSAPAGGTRAVCTDEATAIDLLCPGAVTCNVQWRVDQN